MAKLIVGKCVSKKAGKRQFVFVGNDPQLTKAGWKFTKSDIYEVFDKKVFNAMKRGQKVV